MHNTPYATSWSPYVAWLNPHGYIRLNYIKGLLREQSKPNKSRPFASFSTPPLLVSSIIFKKKIISAVSFRSLQIISNAVFLLRDILECTTTVFWVFGYGSLVWNPGFDYDKKVIGFIRDYRRVFDLDHRGTPEHPARTCTLEEIEGSICWGSAYCVRGGLKRRSWRWSIWRRENANMIKRALWTFMRKVSPFQPALKGVVVFTSSPDKLCNKYYWGPAPLEDMARQIATAFGPCGNNRDYIFRLEKAMFDIGYEDDMVIELANKVRKVLGIVGKKRLFVSPHISL